MSVILTHEEPVRAVAVARSEGRRIVYSGGEDALVRVSTDDGKALKTLKPTRLVMYLGLTSDAVWASGPSYLLSWDRSDYRKVSHPGDPNGAKLFVFGDQIGYGTYHGAVVHPLEAPEVSVKKALGSAHADDDFLYGGYDDGRVRYWKRRGKRAKTLNVGTQSAHVAVADDGFVVTASRSPAHVIVWKRDGASFEEHCRWDTPAAPWGTRMALRVFGPHAVWHNNDTILVVDWKTGEERARFDVPSGDRERCESVWLDGSDLFVGVGNEVRRLVMR